LSETGEIDSIHKLSVDIITPQEEAPNSSFVNEDPVKPPEDVLNTPYVKAEPKLRSISDAFTQTLESAKAEAATSPQPDTVEETPSSSMMHESFSVSMPSTESDMSDGQVMLGELQGEGLLSEGEVSAHANAKDSTEVQFYSGTDWNSRLDSEGEVHQH
jgi:hypothetical protein